MASMLVRKAVIDRLRIVILMAGMSLPLFAQPPAKDRPVGTVYFSCHDINLMIGGTIFRLWLRLIPGG